MFETWEERELRIQERQAAPQSGVGAVIILLAALAILWVLSSCQKPAYAQQPIIVQGTTQVRHILLGNEFLTPQEYLDLRARLFRHYLDHPTDPFGPVTAYDREMADVAYLAYNMMPDLKTLPAVKCGEPSTLQYAGTIACDDPPTLTPAPAPTVVPEPPPAPPAVEVHYAPAENLEAIDLATLDKATRTLDLVEYAFDDRLLAGELLTLAQRGVQIRLYRDQQQWQGEQARAKKSPAADLMAAFSGLPNVHIKVKGQVVLAHLKSYCVDCGGASPVLRAGSANWSTQGERNQDNDLVLIRGQPAAAAFEANFEAIWARAGNQVIQ